jgi:predicted Zn-dependent protease
MHLETTSEPIVSVSQLVASKQLLEAALDRVRHEEYEAALPLFEQLLAREPRSARLRSYHALCEAVTDRRFEAGLERCQAAAKQEFFNPELYLNLARLHLAFGFKAEGVRFIRRGLMIDPGNEELSRALFDLGARIAPVLSFLPRRHPVNRWLGRARSQLVRFSLTARAA